jgi:hypothetical protein
MDSKTKKSRAYLISASEWSQALSVMGSETLWDPVSEQQTVMGSGTLWLMLWEQ